MMGTRALAQSRADQRRFVDRARETEWLMEAVAAAQPVLVLGEPGSGRTSLLNHVAWLLAHQADRHDAVVVPGELAQDPAQLLGVLVARLQRLRRERGERREKHGNTVPEFDTQLKGNFYDVFRNITLHGYYTSEIGFTQELKLQIIPGAQHGCEKLGAGVGARTTGGEHGGNKHV